MQNIKNSPDDKRPRLPEARPWFVQLPTDGAPPSADAGNVINIETHGWLEFPFRDSEPGAMLAVYLATLFRYAQQEQIAVDVYRDGSAYHPLTLALSEATPMSEVSAAAVAALPGVNAESEQPSSNIGISFVEAGSAPASRSMRTRAARYDLHLLVETGGSYRLWFAYRVQLYREASIARLARSLLSVYQASLRDGSCAIGLLNVIAPEDSASQLAMETAAAASIGPWRAVHEQFQDCARRQPTAVAVGFHGEQLTYGELEARSNQLARHLIAAGVGPGDHVAVCVTPSPDVTIAFLAIWKAGAVYIPLDPSHPQALIAQILDEAQPAMVLTQSAVSQLSQPQRFKQFCFDTDAALLASLSETAPAVTADLDRDCYLIYTSGTTGRPKGVRASHRNLAHYIGVAAQLYGFTAADVFCSMARYTFSISMFELVSPLVCGGSLRLLERDEVLSPERLIRNLQGVTVLHAGPSLFGSLLRYLQANPQPAQAFASLRHVSSGGDLVPPNVQEDLKVLLPHAELYVIYGSTEISCMGCTYPIPRDATVTSCLVGKPFPDMAVRIVDPHHSAVPMGVVGEIAFSGKGVVAGYFQRPEQDAEKFVDIEGRRFYLTGDMGRMHADGNVEILGRRDYQIKVRGIRVELPGIENAVRQLRLAVNCAIAVKRLDDQDLRLVAFVVGPREDAGTLHEFRKALGEILPEYMLPQALVAVEALPLTANGKLDRRALDQLPWDVKTVAIGSRPGTAIERQITTAFEHALGIADVGIDDDFFDLGGHSLLVVIVMQELQNTLGLSLPPGLLFERTTARALAEYATRSFVGEEQRPVLLAGDDQKPSLFLLLGVRIYRSLALRLQDRYSVYGVYAAQELTMLENSGATPSIEEWAREYVNIIRRQQPHGPYRLGGISFGGIVAYEVANQFAALGEAVSFLCLIDAILPIRGWRRHVATLRRLLALPYDIGIKVGGRWLLYRVWKLLGIRIPPEFVTSADDQNLRALEERRQGAYRLAATARYARGLTRLPSHIAVVVSGQRLRQDPLQQADCGWGELVPRSHIHVINAGHIELVEEPKVQQVAKIVRDDLERLD